MDELRVILLLIGAAILAAIYFFGGSDKPRQARNGERRQSDDPDAPPERTPPSLDGARDRDPPSETVTRELKRLGDLISREKRPGSRPRRAPRPAEKAPEPPGEPSARKPEESPDKPDRAESDPDRIVVLYVRARAGGEIAGPRLVAAAKMAGLEFGDMDIYHRLDESGSRETIFSMANMVAPGTLEQANTPAFSTPGVALFMRLPGPLRALDAWDAMLATARRLAEILEAEMLDENHSSLNRQRIQQIREEMREYDRLSTLEIRKK